MLKPLYPPPMYTISPSSSNPTLSVLCSPRLASLPASIFFSSILSLGMSEVKGSFVNLHHILLISITFFFQINDLLGLTGRLGCLVFFTIEAFQCQCCLILKKMKNIH